MKINANMARLVVVAIVAFAAGRIGVVGGGGNGVSTVFGQAENHVPPGARAAIDTGRPGRHHRHLEPMIGEWTGEFTIRTGPDAAPLASRGTITREWVLGGRFVKETFEVDGDLGHVAGLSYLGFNNFDGRYEFASMNDMSTAIQFETGTYHPDDKVIHIRGSDRDPVSGRVINSWGKLDMSDPDRHIYVGYSTDPDGKTFKATEGVLVRRENRSER